MQQHRPRNQDGIYALGYTLQALGLALAEKIERYQAGAYSATIDHFADKPKLPPEIPEQAVSADMPEWEFSETAHGSF